MDGPPPGARRALVIGFCAAVAATVLNLESISFSP